MLEEKMEYIIVNEVKYPLVFNLNVMEHMQNEYGSMDEWGKAAEPTKKVTSFDKKTHKKIEIVKKLEPSFKVLIWTFQEFINEGIRKENKSKNEKSEYLTHEDVGDLMTVYGIENLTPIMKRLTVNCMGGEKNPNVEATQK